MPLFGTCGKPRCLALIEPGRKYCARHEHRAAQAEQKRTAVRKRTAPWRMVYDTPEWKVCKRAVRERDGHRCVSCLKAADPRLPGAGLQVHHRAPVQTLWFRAGGDWALFLVMATNPAVCQTLCPSCHKAAEEKLREEHADYRGRARREQGPKRKRRRRR